MGRTHSDLFGLSPKLPDGFKYQLDLMTRNEELALVCRIESLPLKEFEFQGFLGKRRIASFGWRYDFSGGGLQKTDDMPDFLLPIRDKAGSFAGLAPQDLQQVLLTEYRPG